MTYQQFVQRRYNQRVKQHGKAAAADHEIEQLACYFERLPKTICAAIKRGELRRCNVPFFDDIAHELTHYSRDTTLADEEWPESGWK